MDEIFKVIEEQKKGEQLNILLELLQEKGAEIQTLREKYPNATNYIQRERLNCERIKNKIRELYNENIPNELAVQNIAQP